MSGMGLVGHERSDSSRYYGGDGISECSRSRHVYTARYLVKVTAAPLCCVFSGVSVEYGEEALSAYSSEIDYEGMGVLHGPPGPLVLRHADLVRVILCRVSVEDLHCVSSVSVDCGHGESGIDILRRC